MSRALPTTHGILVVLKQKKQKKMPVKSKEVPIPRYLKIARKFHTHGRQDKTRQDTQDKITSAQEGRANQITSSIFIWALVRAHN
jgi:hypothetical protein